ncbi:MAG: potassium channel family protein [Acidobacteriota bacterium]
MIAQQLLWGAGMTLLNVVVHVVSLVYLGRVLSYLMPGEAIAKESLHRAMFLSVAVLILIAIHLVEAGGWALLYCGLGEFDEFPQALYFSIVTATTLGYGDLTLSEPWRLLGVFEAMTGLLLFGASTAAVFQLMVKTLPDPFAGHELEGAE